MQKKAFLTGITGQDGAYLAKFLVDKGYAVHGLLRRSASADVVATRLKWIGVEDQVTLHDGNLTDLSSLIRILGEVGPPKSIIWRRNPLSNHPGSSPC